LIHGGLHVGHGFRKAPADLKNGMLSALAARRLHWILFIKGLGLKALLLHLLFSTMLSCFEFSFS
jgi:hypothetical protein